MHETASYLYPRHSKDGGDIFFGIVSVKLFPPNPAEFLVSNRLDTLGISGSKNHLAICVVSCFCNKITPILIIQNRGNLGNPVNKIFENSSK